MSATATFSALADPTRQSVVSRLARGEATIGELAAPHQMSFPAFTKHIGVLVAAGLVTRRKVGRTVVCRLEPGPLDEAQAWLTDMTAFWQANLDRLEELVGPDGVHDPTPAAPTTASRPPKENG